jgi:hypothetical protein
LSVLEELRAALELEGVGGEEDSSLRTALAEAERVIQESKEERR